MVDKVATKGISKAEVQIRNSALKIFIEKVKNIHSMIINNIY